MEKHISRVEARVRENLNSRGLGHIELSGTLIQAAASLKNAGPVIVLTGFVIRDAMVGETDGPMGAASLTKALEALGIPVTILTDVYSKPLLESCRRVLGLKAQIEIVDHSNVDAVTDRLLAEIGPTHIVSVERPGRGPDGRCYSMRGEDLSDLVPNTDMIFEKAKAQSIRTIAVGDGGNELGMGGIRPHLVSNVPHGSKACSVTEADFLIVAGVSNWGGHALSGALSILSGRDLMHDCDDEEAMLAGIVEAGGVDGCTKQNDMTVDGLDLIKNLSVLSDIRREVQSSLALQTKQTV